MVKSVYHDDGADAIGPKALASLMEQLGESIPKGNQIAFWQQMVNIA